MRWIVGLSAHAPSRTTSAPCAPVPCQFQLSGRNLDQAAEGYRQGRVASRRTLSPRRLHRDEHEPPGRARRCFLQQARDVRAMDQGGQGRDQVDATVVPNVRRQRGAASASCARLQPRRFPAHAGDAGADQGLVADDLEGQADQDRREGSEPRPLCYLPDGRGRHRTANVPRDFAAHRGATAAATTSASVRRSMSCIQEQPTEGVRPNARENGQIRPSTKRSGYPRCWWRSHLASVLQEGRENANIDAGLGFIWRISVYNPPRVPLRISVPITQYVKLRFEPVLGSRVVAAPVVFKLLDKIKQSPTLQELDDFLDPTEPTLHLGGWRLEYFMTDLLLACFEGRRFTDADAEDLSEIFERRSGPIGATVAVTVEMPDDAQLPE